MHIINKYYISGILLSIIIFYLLLNDIKKINLNLYYEIDDKIWMKLYSFMLIAIIHLIWIFSVIILDFDDISIIYAFPYILMVPYTLYVLADTYEINNETIASKKLNTYFNYLMSAYIILIIIVIAVPNSFKINIIHFIKYLINELLKKLH